MTILFLKRFIVLLAMISWCVPARAETVVHPGKLTLRTTKGELLAFGSAKFSVVCFLGTECPLAKLYGSRLKALSRRHDDSEVAFLGVISNLQDGPAEIDAYVARQGIEFPIAHDIDQSVANAFGATRTPEVFVVDRAGLVRYQGRIDDQYAPGIARTEPTQHDLRDALDALLADKAIKQTKTTSVGCLITRAKPKPDPDKATVTFHRDIVPILNQHCIECHRSGEIGPMELSDFEEVIGWGDMILEVIDQKRMPPWHADPTVGEFVGARHLPKRDRDMIATWLVEGMAAGDPQDRPPTPQFNDGWHIESDPDLEIVMRDKPFVVPADGTVEYQYFVVDPKWETDRWISAAQVIPGNPSVVHHSIVFVRPPDGSRFEGIGWLGAYVPGQRTGKLPTGYARRVPAGSKLIFQMHYTPNGSETEDVTKVGIWFAEEQQVTHQVATQVAINHEFELPPGKITEVPIVYRNLPAQGQMMGITPHMHLRGKSFEVSTIGDDGSERILLRVPQYDFNWQHWYQFTESVDLANVESLRMRVAFDNSNANPVNPSPQEYVSWGDQTWEEMAVAFFDVAQPKGSHKRRIRRTEPTQEEIAAWNQKLKKRTDEFLARMDTDGDGLVSREEAPVAFRRFGFREMDSNWDGNLDRAEIEQAASYRP